MVLKRVLLSSLIDAKDEHFACETYLGKSYREPYLDDFFHVNLPGQHSFLVSKDIMTAHGAMHSGDMVRRPNSSVGILRLCVTGKCHSSNNDAHHALVETMRPSGDKIWTPAGVCTLVPVSSLLGAVAYVPVNDGMMILNSVV